MEMGIGPAMGFQGFIKVLDIIVCQFCKYSCCESCLHKESIVAILWICAERINGKLFKKLSFY